MVRLYDTIQDFKILQTLSVKLTWSYLLKFITIEDDLKREFYITMCINEHWSVRALTDRINSMLYERTAISKKPELTIVNDLKQLSILSQKIKTTCINRAEVRRIFTGT
ncbi:DUF1016 N-terminal domain-containing protein [Clostridium gasigenes]|uniref:YhcG N-terminal domain-containing protein n=1 Tax=Clostridium gasigenes TaxID=94869 RepID=A0A1H0P146_9CLOT|nr:DUF1016 N-terminal domain-containing protein [Clostridium gasigenes]SDO98466.1 Protein of unknown function [Clostridium gasigenes]